MSKEIYPNDILIVTDPKHHCYKQNVRVEFLIGKDKVRCEVLPHKFETLKITQIRKPREDEK